MHFSMQMAGADMAASMQLLLLRLLLTAVTQAAVVLQTAR
jgi:hypothetical protein